MAPKTMLQRLSLVCLISSTVPSASALTTAITAAQALGVLEARALTCANSSANACSTVDSRLPGNICCSTNTSCISLDSGSSAICCPKGENCNQIAPISCNLQAQDPAANPDTPIQTTKLSGKLSACGKSCCPFGYQCDSSQLCQLITSTSSLASNFKNNGTSTSSTTSSPTSTSTTSGIDSTKPQPAAICTKFPAAAVAVGFFPGVITGILLTILLILLCGGRGKKNNHSTSSSSYRPDSNNSTFKPQISDPIPLESQSTRSDFLSRTTTRARSIWSKKGSSPKFQQEDTWKMPTPPVPNNIPLAPVNGLIPVTPERQVGRDANAGGVAGAGGVGHQPSTESIRVYSPQNITRPSTNTATPVAPVRGMAGQRERVDSAYGSPFKTPERKVPTSSSQPQSTPSSSYQNTPAGAAAAAAAPYETLTPARYGESNKPDLRSKKGQVSRPTTTFTEMLNEIDFPDPMGSGRGAPPPNVPPIPRGLVLKEKGKAGLGVGARGEWK